jgi:3-dehydroquinate dehydratase-2
MNVRVFGLMVAVTLVSAFAGYGVHRLQQKPPEPAYSSTEQIQARGVPEPDTRINDWSFADLSGERQKLETWAGKIMVVNFWATWCPPCMREIPAFMALQERYGDRGVQFIGIAIDQVENVAMFAQEHGVNYPLLVGDDDVVAFMRSLQPASRAPGRMVRAGRGNGPQDRIVAAITGSGFKHPDGKTSSNLQASRWHLHRCCANVQQSPANNNQTPRVPAVARILLINGPNLNLLGAREPETYGRTTLAEIEAKLTAFTKNLGHELLCFQSNAEHEIIDRLHAAKAEQVAFVVVNPGAFTHTSIALRDAFLGVAIPFIEVHLSNVYTREAFRHESYLSDIARGVITGLGPSGYEFALAAAAEHIAVT